MFAQRLPWPTRTNRLSRLLEMKRREGRHLIDLTESNPTRVGLEYPHGAIAAALADPQITSYDPEPRGLAEARRAVSDYYARRGCSVPPDHIVLTAGTSEAYSLLFKMLSNPGERIVIPRPSYPLFDYLAALEGVRLSHYPIAYEDRFRIDIEAMEREVRRRPGGNCRAVVLVNPNNPTGSAIRAKEMGAIASLCAAQDLAIISDEVFHDFLFDRPGGSADAERIVSMLSPPDPESPANHLGFALGGLSKSCGLPQMKLGWIVVGGREDLIEEALDRLELIADTYLSVGTPVQRGAGRLLELGEGIQEEIRSRININRALLAATVDAESHCRVLEGDGGWYAVMQVPAVLPEEELVMRLLGEDDLLIHPGYFFDFPREAFLILSLLPEPDIFREGVERILARASGG